MNHAEDVQVLTSRSTLAETSIKPCWWCFQSQVNFLVATHRIGWQMVIFQMTMIRILRPCKHVHKPVLF